MKSTNSTAPMSASFELQIPSTATRRFLSVLQTGSIYEIEKALRQLQQIIKGELLDRVKGGLEERGKRLENTRCPRCDRRMNFNRYDGSPLQLLEGEVAVLRSYLHCPHCGFRFHPLDVDLKIPVSGEVTPQFGHDLCLLGVELPGKAGKRLLTALTQRDVHDGLIHAQIQRDGEALVELEREEAEQAWPFDRKASLSDEERLDGPRLRAPPPPDPDGSIIVEIDAVLANVGADSKIEQEIEVFKQRQEEATRRGNPLRSDTPSPYREVRQMRIYRLKDLVIKRTRNGKERRILEQSETVTVVDDPRLFEKRVYAVSRAWRIDEYRDRVVVGDGGKFVWEIAKTLIIPTVETLDYPHAKSHIYDCARALFADSSESKPWAKKWSRHLKDHGVLAFTEELKRLSSMTWSDEGSRKLRNLIEYFNEHQKRVHYPDFKSQGFPIASGAIESANRQVVGDRVKRSGMRWTRAGLQRLLSLRAALLSGNWELACRAIRERRQTQLRPATSLEKAGPSADPPSRSASALPPPSTTAFSRPHSPFQSPVPTPQPPSLNPPKPASKPLIPDRKLARLRKTGFVMPEDS